MRAVVFRDDRILLVRETEDGRWTLPGGWADEGYTAAQAVAPLLDAGLAVLGAG